MTQSIGSRTHRTSDSEAETPSSLEKIGLAIAGIGLGIALLGLLASLIAGALARENAIASDLATFVILAFALSVAGFGTIKFGIGVILLGIIRHLRLRIGSIKVTLPALVPEVTDRSSTLGDYVSPFGPATATATTPKPLPVHRIAKLMWSPMLAAGIVLVAIGLLLAIAAGVNSADELAARSSFAWIQGLQFLGEGSLLAGISLLLGSILGAIRADGGELQQSLGVTVRTIQMPTMARMFTGLMIGGAMIEVLQFLGYALLSSVEDATNFAAWSAFLGPFRELGLGLLLAGIVLALATIAKVLGFQFARINEIIKTGR